MMFRMTVVCSICTLRLLCVSKICTSPMNEMRYLSLQVFFVWHCKGDQKLCAVQYTSSEITQTDLVRAFQIPKAKREKHLL